MLEHTIRLHTCKTIQLNLSVVTCIFYVLSPCTVYIKLSNFILFSLENDDMESSKCCVKLLSLIFIIRCLTKSNLIRRWKCKREKADTYRCFTHENWPTRQFHPRCFPPLPWPCSEIEGQRVGKGIFREPWMPISNCRESWKNEIISRDPWKK